MARRAVTVEHEAGTVPELERDDVTGEFDFDVVAKFVKGIEQQSELTRSLRLVRLLIIVGRVGCRRNAGRF